MKINTKQVIGGCAIAFATAVLPGCASSEDNPITPDKMEQIRQQEASQRGNFAPPAGKAGPPPSSTGK